MWHPEWLVKQLMLTQQILNPPNTRVAQRGAQDSIREQMALSSFGRVGSRKPRLRQQGGYWFCGTGWSAGGIGRDPKDAYSSWRLANTPGNSLGRAL